MKRLFAAIAVSLSLASFAFAQLDRVNVVPKPNMITSASGSFIVDRNTVIVAQKKDERRSAEILADRLSSYGFSLKIVSKPPAKNFIQLLPPSLGLQHGEMPKAQSLYAIHVEPSRIRIEGFDKGQFYAIQTFTQLIPVTASGNAVIALLLDTDRKSYQRAATDDASLKD